MFDSSDALKQIYEESKVSDSEKLFEQHIEMNPHLVDLTKGLDSVLASLALKKDEAGFSGKLE